MATRDRILVVQLNQSTHTCNAAGMPHAYVPQGIVVADAPRNDHGKLILASPRSQWVESL